jgi:hypothetical protein
MIGSDKMLKRLLVKPKLRQCHVSRSLARSEVKSLTEFEAKRSLSHPFGAFRTDHPLFSEPILAIRRSWQLF